MRGKRSKSQLLKLSMEANLHYQLSYRLSALDFLETYLFIRKASVAKFRYIFAIFSFFFCWVSGYEDGYASYRQ